MTTASMQCIFYFMIGHINNNLTLSQVSALTDCIARLVEQHEATNGASEPVAQPIRDSIMASVLKMTDRLDSVIGDNKAWAAPDEKLQDAHVAALEQQRKTMQAHEQNARRSPFEILRPSLLHVAGQWFAVYGEALEDRLVGQGSTPAAALEDFNARFHRTRPLYDKKTLEQSGPGSSGFETDQPPNSPEDGQDPYGR